MKPMNVKAIADSMLCDIAAKPGKSKELLILSAGEDPASMAYMRGKLNDCSRCGIPCRKIVCADQASLVSWIAYADEESSVGGIIVQLPLPNGWDESVVDMVRPVKDVDGFVVNSRFKPCTPEGIILLMKEHFGSLRGLDVLQIGKGKLVGEPLIKLLLEEGCTPTICHSKTKALKNKLLRYHDVVITATGQGDLVDLMDVNAELVIDATIVRGADGKLHGDCYGFDPEYNKNLTYTPVPGGVGLMTRAVLMEHMMEVQ